MSGFDPTIDPTIYHSSIVVARDIFALKGFGLALLIEVSFLVVLWILFVILEPLSEFISFNRINAAFVISALLALSAFFAFWQYRLGKRFAFSYEMLRVIGYSVLCCLGFFGINVASFAITSLFVKEGEGPLWLIGLVISSIIPTILLLSVACSFLFISKKVAQQ